MAVLVVGTVPVTVVLGRGRQRQTTRAWLTRNAHEVWRWRTHAPAAVASVLVWTILIVGVVGWDLTSFLFQSHLLPTLSYFVGRVTRYPIGRGILFLVWIGIGTYLVAGWRAEVPR